MEPDSGWALSSPSLLIFRRQFKMWLFREAFTFLFPLFSVHSCFYGIGLCRLFWRVNVTLKKYFYLCCKWNLEINFKVLCSSGKALQERTIGENPLAHTKYANRKWGSFRRDKKKERNVLQDGALEATDTSSLKDYRREYIHTLGSSQKQSWTCSAGVMLAMLVDGKRTSTDFSLSILT